MSSGLATSRSSAVSASILFTTSRGANSLRQLHPPHRPHREVTQQFPYRDLERAAEAEGDGEAGDFRTALQVARVGGGDAGGFGELLLGPAGVEPELAEAFPEYLCFDGHVG